MSLFYALLFFRYVSSTVFDVIVMIICTVCLKGGVWNVHAKNQLHLSWYVFLSKRSDRIIVSHYSDIRYSFKDVLCRITLVGYTSC